MKNLIFILIIFQAILLSCVEVNQPADNVIKVKALRMINRKGQGGEEYTYITKIILDEDNNEILVHDHHIKKIYVYDLYGNFKRSFSYKENTKGWLYTDMRNYNKTNLICFDEYNVTVLPSSLVIINIKS